MTTISEEQVSKLLDDLASIKSIIGENKSVMKQLLLPIHFRFISFFSGVGIIGICALYYFLLERFGEYGNIPPDIQKISIVATFCLWLMTIVLKRVMWLRSVRKVDQQITFKQITRNLFRAQIFHIWIPIIILMLLVSIYLVMMDSSRYIVPLVCFGFGIIYNTIGSLSRIPQYLIVGYWMLLTGILPFLFPSMSVLIFLALSVGGGLLLFGALVGKSK